MQRGDVNHFCQTLLFSTHEHFVYSSSGVTVFSLTVEDDLSAPTASTFHAFLSCKGCGQLLGDTPLGAGFDLGNLDF